MTRTEEKAIADALRQQRTLTPAEVLRRGEKHQATARYELRMERIAPGAH